LVRRRSDHHTRSPDVSIEFENDPGAPAAVRRGLRPLFSSPSDPIADSVELVASELVSNVVQHTDGGGTAQAWDPDPDVPFLLEVTDSGSGEPAAATPNDDGGRGLRIVDDIADRWGVNPRTHGKTVWAEFDRTEPDEPDDG